MANEPRWLIRGPRARMAGTRGCRAPPAHRHSGEPRPIPWVAILRRGRAQAVRGSWNQPSSRYSAAHDAHRRGINRVRRRRDADGKRDKLLGERRCTSRSRRRSSPRPRRRPVATTSARPSTPCSTTRVITTTSSTSRRKTFLAGRYERDPNIRTRCRPTQRLRALRAEAVEASGGRDAVPGQHPPGLQLAVHRSARARGSPP